MIFKTIHKFLKVKKLYNFVKFRMMVPQHKYKHTDKQTAYPSHRISYEMINKNICLYFTYIKYVDVKTQLIVQCSDINSATSYIKV